MLVELTPTELRAVVHALQARALMLRARLQEAGTSSEGWRAVRRYMVEDEELASRLDELLRRGP
jgi:hypothetical protein